MCLCWVRALLRLRSRHKLARLSGHLHATCRSVYQPTHQRPVLQAALSSSGPDSPLTPANGGVTWQPHVSPFVAQLQVCRGTTTTLVPPPSCLQVLIDRVHIPWWWVTLGRQADWTRRCRRRIGYPMAPRTRAACPLPAASPAWTAQVGCAADALALTPYCVIFTSWHSRAARIHAKLVRTAGFKRAS